MSGKRRVIALTVFATLFAISAVGQDEKNEIGGQLGRTFISDQGITGATFFDPIIHSGKGLSFEGEYARRFWVMPVYSIAAEGVFVYNWDTDLNAGQFGNSVVPSDLKKLFITPAARLNLFPTTAVSPWVSFGAGFAHVSENKQLIYDGVSTGRSTTSAAIELGLGLDVRVWRKLSIRSGVRDFWAGEAGFSFGPNGQNAAA